MSRWYLDASAAAKLLVEEEESSRLADRLRTSPADLCAGMLLETELRRFAQRIDAVTQSAVSTLLDGVHLYDVPASLFREAGLLAGPGLRSLDALHLVTAVRLGAEAMICYDERLARAAEGIGLPVIAP